MEAAFEHLLDFTTDFDVVLLDQIVSITFEHGGLHPKRQAANDFLEKLRDHPEMWRRADAILEGSQLLQTRFFGLQVLESMISTRWKIIPEDQREGIRNYIVGKVMALSSTDEIMLREHLFLSRLNLVLVQILKQDWPHNWPSFIGDLVGSSRSSECLCENNMHILKLLAEEVFEFSKGNMTTDKVAMMKASFTDEFRKIFELCQLILDASQRPTLVLATLVTLQKFIPCIQLGYIFETQLLPTLVNKFLPVPTFRTATLDCLTEIAALNIDAAVQYCPIIQQMLVIFNQQLASIIPRY